MSFTSALLILFTATAPQAANASLVGQAEIVTESRDILVRDVVDVATIPSALRGRVAGVQIARLPSHGGSFEFSAKQLAELVRRRVPTLHIAYSDDARRTVRISMPEHRYTRNDRCYSLVVAVKGGSIIQHDDVTRGACDAQANQRALYFDRTHKVVRASADLSAGTFLGSIALPKARMVDAGEELVFRFSQGPVVVERAVRTVQSGKSGKNVFVQAKDGKVFSAAYHARDNRQDDTGAQPVSENIGE